MLSEPGRVFDGCLAGLEWSALRPLTHAAIDCVHCSFHKVAEGCTARHMASIKNAHVNLAKRQGMTYFFLRVLLWDKCVFRPFLGSFNLPVEKKRPSQRLSNTGL